MFATSVSDSVMTGEVRRISSCPRWAFSLTRDKIFLVPSHPSPQIELNLEAIAPHIKGIGHLWTRKQLDAGVLPEAVLGEGQEPVLFEGVRWVERRRYDSGHWDGHRNAPQCFVDEIERVEIRRPGQALIWELMGTLKSTMTPGSCR